MRHRAHLIAGGRGVRHLIALQAVVAAGSFNAAAARLGYTQSAVSAQIRTLERLVGMRLLDRSRGVEGVRLTKEGTILLQYASDIVARFEAASDHLLCGREEAAAEIRLDTVRELEDSTAVAAFVAAGLGVGLAPEFATSPRPESSRCASRATFRRGRSRSPGIVSACRVSPRASSSASRRRRRRSCTPRRRRCASADPNQAPDSAQPGPIYGRQRSATRVRALARAGGGPARAAAPR